MIEKSLGSFAFKGLIFYEFDSNRLLIELINAEINVTEAAFTDPIGPVEEVMLNFFDSVLSRVIFRYHWGVVLFHLWIKRRKAKV